MEHITSSGHRRWILQSLRNAITTVSAVADSDDVLAELVDAHRGLEVAERYLASTSTADAPTTRLRMNLVDALTELSRARVQVAWALMEADETKPVMTRTPGSRTRRPRPPVAAC